MTTTDGWIGGKGVILVTHDGGRTWVQQYSGSETIHALDIVNLADGWAVGDTTLLHTTDGGQIWAPVDEPLQQISFVNEAVGWGVGKNILYRTTNGGHSWSPIRTPIPVGDFCFLDARDGWIVNPSVEGSTAVLARTPDGGKTWQLVPLALDMSYVSSFAHAIRCTAPDTLWDLLTFGPGAGGEGYVLTRSSDGGASWSGLLQSRAPSSLPQLQALPFLGPGPYPGALTIVNAETAFFSGICTVCDGPRAGIGVIGTTDGGRTWSQAQIPGPEGAGGGAISFPDAQHGWLIMSWDVLPSRELRSAVFATADGGQTWTQQYPDTP